MFLDADSGPAWEGRAGPAGHPSARRDRRVMLPVGSAPRKPVGRGRKWPRGVMHRAHEASCRGRGDSESAAGEEQPDQDDGQGEEREGAVAAVQMAGGEALGVPEGVQDDEGE